MTTITTKEGAAIYATFEGNVLCSVVNADLTRLIPCSNEEADTLLLLHVADAFKAGSRKACVDTYVVIMTFVHYNNIKPDELWMVFGTGSHFRYVHVTVHQLTASLDSKMCSTFHVFHAFTGFGIVSSFGVIGKKTAGVTCQSYQGATGVFENLLWLMRMQKSRAEMHCSCGCDGDCTE